MIFEEKSSIIQKTLFFNNTGNKRVKNQEILHAPSASRSFRIDVPNKVFTVETEIL